MGREYTQQVRMGRVLSLAIWAIGVGMLFPACSSSGLAKGSADASSHFDGTTGGASGSGGITSFDGSTSAGGTTSSGATGGSTPTGGATGATGGTTSSPPNCAMVGCSEPPLCSVGCTAPCGCCPCGLGERRGDLICTKSGCYASAVAPDAGFDQAIDAPHADARQGGEGGSGGTIGTGGSTQTGDATSSGGATSADGATHSGGVADSGAVTDAGGVTSAGGVTATGGTTQKPGHFQMEKLDRGLVAVKVAGGVYLGWRMFGYEYSKDSPASVAYNIYRGGDKLATVSDSTNYLDAAGTASSTYTVTAIVNGTEGAPCPAATPWAQNYLRIPISAPAASPSGASYSANDGSPGDLDGDGQYDIVLKWNPSDAKDDSSASITSNVFLDGYTLAGKRLWRIDLGPNIHAGPHYAEFVVYDFDGDGKAELAVKTAPGTKDGTGTFLHTGPAANDDDGAVYRNLSGDILTGPEYLTVFRGTDGAELATVNFAVGRWPVAEHAASAASRTDSFLSAAGFISDTGAGMAATGRPSILMARGIFTRTTITAWNWRDGLLTKVWTMDSNAAGNSKYAGQAAHSMMVADADGDGAQEIIWGPATIGSDGTPKCSTGFGLGYALHVGDLVPSRPGLEVFVVPGNGTLACDVHDALTCEVIAQIPAAGVDNGGGVADDIASGNPGAEMWSTGTAALYSATDGSSVGSKPDSTNFLVYWDADESRELEDGTSITKYGGGTLVTCAECASNNGAKSTPTLTADLLGDWREEIIWREADNTGLRLYTTTDVTARRIYTLMHDPQYRMQVTSEQTGFNQPPHVGFHIGNGMAQPPTPDIYVPSRMPLRHRAAGVSCPAQRGLGSVVCSDGAADASCSFPGTCTHDSDCTAGVNGRCMVLGPGPPGEGCSYDECMSDADCPARLPCSCRTLATDSAANYCVTDSDCRVDADCGAGSFCSPSTSQSGSWCGLTYHCHTARDACLDDSDCAVSTCNFDYQQGFWACGFNCNAPPP